MRKFIKYFYNETKIGAFLLNPSKKLYKYYRTRMIPEKKYIKDQFEVILNYELNLDNPKTLNEKIQWLKFNDRRTLHTICADKYAVREHIKERIGEKYLIPLLYKTENVNDIHASNLPDEPFVIKTNHDSGGVVLVQDKNNMDWKDVRKDLLKKLKTNYYYTGKEWQYKNIKPCIIIEELLLDENNNIPSDYKLHCFNGKLKFTQIDTGRFENHERHLHDIDWNLIDCQWFFKSGEGVEKPKLMDKMQELAEELAKDFDYVRIDLYNIGEKIYFGEITFTPGSGWEFFSPIECDRKFGEMLNLTKRNS